MNKFLITIVATLLMAGTGSLFAQDSDDGSDKNGPEQKGSENRRQHQQRGMQPTQELDQLMNALRKLNLSDEQRVNTRAILEVMRAEIHPIIMEIRTGQEQLRKLLKSSTFDEDRIRVLADREGDLTAERIMITSLAFSRVKAELTDEQRAELDVIAANRNKYQKRMRAQ